MVVGDKIKLQLEVEAVLQAALIQRSARPKETTMGIVRLNHAVLYVRDAERIGRRSTQRCSASATVASLRRAERSSRRPDSTNDHDIAFFTIGADAGPSAAGGHASGCTTWRGRCRRWPSWRELAGALTEAGALVGASDHGASKSLYAHDPDGLEFEVCWIVPADAPRRRRRRRSASVRSTSQAEIARFGEAPVGGR